MPYGIQLFDVGKAYLLPPTLEVKAWWVVSCHGQFYCCCRGVCSRGAQRRPTDSLLFVCRDVIQVVVRIHMI